MQKKKTAPFLSLLLCCTLLLTALAGCAASSPVAQSQATESFEPPESANQASDRDSILPSGAEPPDIETGLIPEQVLEGETGTIHYSYYLPENYDPQKNYPLMMVMPGYDMMWFGEESSGSNLSWDGFLCWTKLPEEMIVASRLPVALPSSASADFPYFSVRLTTSMCRKMQYFGSCVWSSKVFCFAS